jgi:hypothetical protein
MVPLQLLDHNASRSVPSITTLSDDYGNQQELLSSRLQIVFDGINLSEQYFELDSDVDSFLSENSDNSDWDDDSSCDSDNDHVEFSSETLRTLSQNHIWPLFDDSLRMNRRRFDKDGDIDDLVSLNSFDSLMDAGKRGILKRSTKHQEHLPSRQKLQNQRQHNVKSKAHILAADVAFESDEESLTDYYCIRLK